MSEYIFLETKYKKYAGELKVKSYRYCRHAHPVIDDMVDNMGYKSITKYAMQSGPHTDLPTDRLDFLNQSLVEKKEPTTLNEWCYTPEGELRGLQDDLYPCAAENEELRQHEVVARHKAALV